MIGAAIGAGLGLATARWQDRRQLEQQKKLQDLAIEGSKQMGAYNQQLALDMWEKTNYDAQRKQMEKAGLNVGLMYGSGGAGGGTTNTPTGSVGMGSASGGSGEIGMGMQMGLAAQQAQANIELTKAQTQNVQANTVKTTGADTDLIKTNIENIKTNTDKMKAETDNTKLQGQIMEFQKQLEEVNVKVAKGSADDVIKQNKQLALKYVEEVKALGNQNQITEKTMKNQIELARLAVTEANMRIAMAKSGMELNQAQITKMSMDLLNKQEELRQNNRSLDQKDVQNMLQQWQTEFNIGSSTQGGIMNAAKVINDIIPF